MKYPERGTLEEQKGGQPVPRAGRGDVEVTVQGCGVFVSFRLDENVLNVTVVAEPSAGTRNAVEVSP